MIFVCPKCMGKLNITDAGAARCESGHSYDRSRYGYYNLLLSAGGGIHGDNREMILARRQFLGSGAYGRLAELIAARCSEHLAAGGVMLDAGCGEGYYTSCVKAKLDGVSSGVRIAAFEAINCGADQVIFSKTLLEKTPLVDHSFGVSLL